MWLDGLQPIIHQHELINLINFTPLVKNDKSKNAYDTN
jgi:hypothetical protein